MTASPSLSVVDLAADGAPPRLDAIAEGLDLPARFVIQPTAAPSGPVNADVVRRTTATLLWKAEELACRSLALHAFAAADVPVAEVAEIEVEEVRRHLASGSRLGRVVFAVHGDEAVHAFQAAVDATA